MTTLARQVRRNLGGGTSGLLETDFSLVPDQPVSFADGQVLDTEDEGIVSGVLTATINAGGSLTVLNNTLRLTHNTSRQVAAVTSDDMLVPSSKIVTYTVYGVIHRPQQTADGTSYFLNYISNDTVLFGRFNLYNDDTLWLVTPSTGSVFIPSAITPTIPYDLRTIVDFDAKTTTFQIRGGSQYLDWTEVGSGEFTADPTDFYIYVAGQRTTVVGTDVDKIEVV